MKIILSIDDTDSLDSRGTGELADMISKAIEDFHWGTCYAITRHQFLLHKDIPYTSHNSSMGFTADIKPENLEKVINYASDFLKRESEPEADPGLCIVVIDDVKEKEKLIAFGYKAQREVLTKENAYELAHILNVHLSEHGGTGQGIIGALAGAGLRLSGNDGRFKGSIKIDAPDNVITVAELCQNKNIDKVRNLQGVYLEDDEKIMLDKLVKTVLIDGNAVLLVDEINEEDKAVRWKVCSKQQLVEFEEMKANLVSE